MKTKTKHSGALYVMVKKYILDQIISGKWESGDRIPSENKLVDELNVSRMTVNRALTELAANGTILRIGGVGSFVADPRVQGHIMEIRNIEDEIRERGHEYSSKIIRLERVRASTKVTNMLELSPNTTVFHSIFVNIENNLPIQLEDRYVNPVFAPDYLEIDFSNMSPTEYLFKLNVLQEVEHVVHAILPDKSTMRHLKMEVNEPCLLLERRTWSSNSVVTYSRLYHPSSRYSLGERFAPKTF